MPRDQVNNPQNKLFEINSLACSSSHQYRVGLLPNSYSCLMPYNSTYLFLSGGLIIKVSKLWASFGLCAGVHRTYPNAKLIAENEHLHSLGQNARIRTRWFLECTLIKHCGMKKNKSGIQSTTLQTLFYCTPPPPLKCTKCSRGEGVVFYFTLFNGEVDS